MKLEPDIKLDFDDVQIKPKRSVTASRASVDLTRGFSFPYSSKTITATPLIAANMDSTGTIAMADTLYNDLCLTALHKFYRAEEYPVHTLRAAFYTMGIQRSEFHKLKHLVERIGFTPPFICVDVANGYTQQFVEFVRDVREYAPDSVIMAGNVATAEMTQELIINGKADIVKVGIGPGSVCTTRLKTGVGYPQLSAIAECADVAHGLNAHICADGGCKNPGDVAKAFGAGADFVMLGGMLAGTDECEGEWTYEYFPGKIIGYDGNANGCFPIYDIDTQPKKKKALAFHGMSSREAMEQHNSGMADYKTAEGVEIVVPYKGPASKVIKDILGGLRSTCAYIGATNIKDLPKACTFIRVNRTKEYLYDIKND